MRDLTQAQAKRTKALEAQRDSLEERLKHLKQLVKALTPGVQLREAMSGELPGRRSAAAAGREGLLRLTPL